jgi:bacterioferritin-associated ferredoxin
VIVCSCAVVSQRDIELAVFQIMSSGLGLLPTPGLVFRHLKKRMNCCSCASVTVSTIYAAIDHLAEEAQLCPFVLAQARAKLIRIEDRRERRQRRIEAACYVRRNVAA